MDIKYDESYQALRYYGDPFYDISYKAAKSSNEKNEIKIVVLHGWGQDSLLGIKTMKRIRDRLGKQGIRLIFVTSPHSLPMTSNIEIEGKMIEINNFSPDRNPNTWFSYHDDSGILLSEEESRNNRGYVPEDFLTKSLPYHGWLESVHSIGTQLKHELGNGQNIDGILGFSQGATMAHILCSIKHDNQFMKDNPECEWLSSLKFSIFAGGFPSRLHPSPFQPDLTNESINLPTLHFSGQLDNDVPTCFHHELAACFRNPVIHHHSKGHIVPNNSADVNAMLSFLTQFR